MNHCCNHRAAKHIQTANRISRPHSNPHTSLFGNYDSSYEYESAVNMKYDMKCCSVR